MVRVYSLYRIDAYTLGVDSSFDCESSELRDWGYRPEPKCEIDIETDRQIDQVGFLDGRRVALRYL